MILTGLKKTTKLPRDIICDILEPRICFHNGTRTNTIHILSYQSTKESFQKLPLNFHASLITYLPENMINQLTETTVLVGSKSVFMFRPLQEISIRSTCYKRLVSVQLRSTFINFKGRSFNHIFVNLCMCVNVNVLHF